jgi:exonuclease III
LLSTPHENRHLQHQQRQRRLPNLLAWLKRARPDVVCLQELKAADDAFPEAELSREGYGGVARPEDLEGRARRRLSRYQSET